MLEKFFFWQCSKPNSSLNTMSHSPSARRHCDVSKLLAAGYEVEMESASGSSFFVKFLGPKESPYENVFFQVRVELPELYPFKSPSIGFVTRIYHPNIDERSGTVCLNVLNQTWTPMYSLINVFEMFLPQLLTYPNADDPLNPEAAGLYKRNFEQFIAKARAMSDEHGEPAERDIVYPRRRSRTGSNSASLGQSPRDSGDTSARSSLSGHSRSAGSGNGSPTSSEGHFASRAFEAAVNQKLSGTKTTEEACDDISMRITCPKSSPGAHKLNDGHGAKRKLEDPTDTAELSDIGSIDELEL